MEFPSNQSALTEYVSVFYNQIPFNADISIVREEVERQRLVGNDISVITVKPSDPEFAMHDFYEIVETMICESQTPVLCISQKCLSEAEVRELYVAIFEDRGEETESIVQFRTDLITYMSSGCVRSYLLAGYRASDVAQCIKDVLRAQHLPKGQQKRVRNIVHTPETHEVDKDIGILFGGVQ